MYCKVCCCVQDGIFEGQALGGVLVQPWCWFLSSGGGVYLWCPYDELHVSIVCVRLVSLEPPPVWPVVAALAARRGPACAERRRMPNTPNAVARSELRAPPNLGKHADEHRQRRIPMNPGATIAPRLAAGLEVPSDAPAAHGWLHSAPTQVQSCALRTNHAGTSVDSLERKSRADEESLRPRRQAARGSGLGRSVWRFVMFVSTYWPSGGYNTGAVRICLLRLQSGLRRQSKTAARARVVRNCSWSGSGTSS
jgi:hypothetical protein